MLAPGGEVLEWPAALRAYQHDGVRAFLAHDRLLLADDMGLGKTIQAIAALRILIHRGEVTRALIVVPASLRTQWRREFATWAPELRLLTVHGPAEEREWQWRTDAHVTLVSYETLRGDVVGNPASGPRWREWDVVVLDEAQRIKNRNTTTSRACKLLPRQRSWAMTGTPLENSI
ncbi:MAG TPA: SNF2-related protein, partial [Vicinamibacterales bacterium]|nr:SNF2-related protein [Vicinamibacterales bacterium]